MAHNSMFSIINDTLYRHKPLEETFQDFEPFLDFYFTPYQLFYVYFLEEAALEDCLAQLRDYCQRQMPYVTVHGIYTRNTLTLFFKDCSQDYGPFIRFLSNMKLPRQNVRQEVETAAFGDLRSLLFVVLEKIRRYSVIYYVHSFHILSSYNYGYVSAGNGTSAERGLKRGDAGNGAPGGVYPRHRRPAVFKAGGQQPAAESGAGRSGDLRPVDDGISALRQPGNLPWTA